MSFNVSEKGCRFIFLKRLILKRMSLSISEIDPEKNVCKTGGYALHESLTFILILFQIPENIFPQLKKLTSQQDIFNNLKRLNKASCP